MKRKEKPPAPVFPYCVGDRVWFFKRDEFESDLESKEIIDISMNGKISVERMKDGRSFYCKTTSFFFKKNDAIDFMVDRLLTANDDMKDLMREYSKRIASLDAERHST